LKLFRSQNVLMFDSDQG